MVESGSANGRESGLQSLSMARAPNPSPPPRCAAMTPRGVRCQRVARYADDRCSSHSQDPAALAMRSMQAAAGRAAAERQRGVAPEHRAAVMAGSDPGAYRATRLAGRPKSRPRPRSLGSAAAAVDDRDAARAWLARLAEDVLGGAVEADVGRVAAGIMAQAAALMPPAATTTDTTPALARLVAQLDAAAAAKGAT